MAADLTQAVEAVATGLAPHAIRLEWVAGPNLRVNTPQSPLEAALRDTLAAALAGAPRGAHMTLTADRETETCVVRLSTDCPLTLPPGTPALGVVAERAGGIFTASPSGFVVRLPRA
jgi:hypothetical protein